MPRRVNRKPLSKWKSKTPASKPGDLSVRIIGGKFRGRKLKYTGDPRTRPMQDVTREALFNLVGGYIKGKHVVDLFAGTAAVTLEAISRGAVSGTVVERHFPTAKVINENIETLETGAQIDVVISDTFFWSRQFIREFEANVAEMSEKTDSAKSEGPLAQKNVLDPNIPWAVFCCPPYAFFLEREEELMATISGLIEIAPKGSLFVTECDPRFALKKLPMAKQWRTRAYSPAVISILHLDHDEAEMDPPNG